MNKISIATLASFALASMLSAQNAIRIGGVDFTPAFEDDSLSGTNRTIIGSDLERYFSYSGTLNLIFDFSYGTEDVQLETLINSRHNVNISTNVTIASMASQRLSLPKALSDTYTNLLVSTPASTSLLQSATAFIEEFNTGNVTNYSDAAICHLFRTADSWMPLTATNDIRAGLKSYWTKKKYTKPCIIDFAVGKIWPDRDDVQAFMVRSISTETNELPSTTSYLICYDGTEWFMLAL